MIRKVFASREAKIASLKSSNGKIEIYSFFPCDKYDCECQPLVLEWKKKLAVMPPSEAKATMKEKKFLECPKSRVGYNRYEITCKNCSHILGYCYSKDSTLKDFFDFHYVSWTNGNYWYGCFTPSISPISQQLCIECTCGQDTRDFRANMTLPSETASMIEKSNSKGRDFGTKDSKFAVRQVGTSVIPF